jgi:hypothetical protein
VGHLAVHSGACAGGGDADPAPDGWRDRRPHCRHTEHLSYLLAEMQVLHRAHGACGDRHRPAATTSRPVPPQVSSTRSSAW